MQDNETIDDQTTGNLRVLKGVVIGLGVLIVLGFVALVWGIIHKVGEQRRHPPSATAPRLALPPINWTAKNSLPAGAKVVSATLADGRLIVTVSTPQGVEIRLFDISSGLPAGVLTLSAPDASAKP